MVKSLTKAVFKPTPQSPDEYIVLIGDASAAEVYLSGNHTLPLVSIVSSFDIFHCPSPSTTKALPSTRASKQQLDAAFGTANVQEVVETMLRRGRIVVCDAPPRRLDVGSRFSASSCATSRGSHSGGHSGGR